METSDYKINGQTVSAEEWQSFVDALNEVTQYLEDRHFSCPSIAQGLSDQEMSTDEMPNFGSTYEDNVIEFFTMGDAYSTHADNYSAESEEILEHYGFRIADILECAYSDSITVAAISTPDSFVETTLFYTRDEWAFSYLSPQIEGVRDILMNILEQSTRSYEYLPQSVREDPEFVASAMAVHPGIIHYISSELFYQAAVPYLLTLANAFGEMDTDFSHWLYNPYIVGKMIVNWKPATEDQRPIALVIYPESDHNGAFLSPTALFALWHSNFYRVIYDKAGNEDEAAEIIRTVKNSYQRKIDVLILAGHGDGTSLQLGQDRTDERSFIDVGDFSQAPEEDDFGSLIRDAIDPSGQIIFESCYSGVGGASDDNLVNQAAQSMPSGITITGFQEASPMADMDIDPSNGEISIQLHDNDPLYIAYGLLR